ncbi:delta-1-pyrroline-5-carboxylate synthase [Mayamaea pseudoterrestris]|nr:delta-1-pyrroline-5-carboxylate synthase [Mayamaea pseudoterrestris]
MEGSKNITGTTPEPPSRAALRRARRVCVKAGTSVVANEDGRPSLTRLGAMVEQIAELVNEGVQVILVSSGAVGMGKLLLRKQSKMMMSLKDSLASGGSNKDEAIGAPLVKRHESFVSMLNIEQRPHSMAERNRVYDSACAAAGQFEMMNLYNSLFAQCDVAASQVLVTQTDFTNEKRLNNLKYAMERLLSLGIVPIVNENDAVSANLGYTADDVFSDNDSLAALCARSFDAEVLLLLTDVPGVFDRPPGDPHASLISFYRAEYAQVAIGEKSLQGRGGMGSKIDAAVAAVAQGAKTSACVVGAGSDLNCIRAVLGRETRFGVKGTLFCTPGSVLEKQAILDFETSNSSGQTAILDEARNMAIAARLEARKLQLLPYSVRQNILRAVALALIERKEEIMEANKIDLDAAERDGIADALKSRLKLTETKLTTLAIGLNQLSDLPDPLGVIKAKRELSDGLELTQVSVPIGVLMIVFESRPDSMPQISALAVASGNGLLLKGGKEAAHSNALIYKVIGDAIETGSENQIKRNIIGLVTSRGQVADMLSLDDVIDLVIPRGSNSLVSYIKANTKIPVLGHADGVCHVYVDESADADAACKIAVDAKTDYPSACNAMETLLLHRETIDNNVASTVLMALRAAGVRLLGGPEAMKRGLCDTPAVEMKYEYGDLTCLVEVVQNMDEAIDWIHKYGSSHTEAIVCGEESEAGEAFLRRVDSACVFKNASTRFSDGYRFGLGAEVGISTGRIHSRGPVGVEGLLSTKWQLRSRGGVNYVGEFSGDNPKVYTHKDKVVNV